MTHFRSSIICLLLCISQSVAAGIWKRLDSKTLKFEGEIGTGDFERFKSVFDNKVTQLIVNSPGGDGYEAVRIGNELLKHKIDVYVAGECMSACANALFLAGHRKFLDGNPVINGKMTGQMGYVCFHGGAGLGDKERVNKDQAESGDRLLSDSEDENYKNSKKFFLDAAKAGQPLSPKGFAIKNAKDHDRYWRHMADGKKASSDFFLKTGASPRLMTLFFETGNDWNCPTQKGFVALGVKEVFGKTTLLDYKADIVKPNKMYIFDGTFPENEPACVTDLAKLKTEGRCGDKENIQCLRNQPISLSSGCKTLLGILPQANDVKDAPLSTK